MDAGEVGEELAANLGVVAAEGEERDEGGCVRVDGQLAVGLGGWRRPGSGR